jgi:hypothetical protein
MSAMRGGVIRGPTSSLETVGATGDRMNKGTWTMQITDEEKRIILDAEEKLKAAGVSETELPRLLIQRAMGLFVVKFPPAERVDELLRVSSFTQELIAEARN